MMKIFFPLLLLAMVSAIDCLTLPALRLTEFQQLIANYTKDSPSLTNGVAHALCESKPTHLICGNTLKYGHKVLQHLPASLLIKPCDIFIATPHCCDQFCRPGNGGTCDSSGACFCNPAGVPNVCQLIMKTKDTPPASLDNNDQAVLDMCQTKCANNPNGCTKPAATTDGVAGIVCMCYCDPAGDGPTETTTPTPDIGLPELASPIST